MGKASQKKKNARQLTHVVQARITAVTGKHVCVQCGADASLLDVSYEVLSQDQADRIAQEARKQTTADRMLRAVKESEAGQEVGEATWQATLREQREGLPREHHRSYRCFRCMAWLLTSITGVAHGGEVVLARLLSSPASNALFIVRRVKDPESAKLLNTPFQDMATLFVALRHENAITRLQITSIEPEEKSL